MAGKFIRRLFALANRPERAVYQPRWFRHDIQAIEDLLDADNGTAMITQPRVKQVSHPTNITWSDACREVDGNFSGAGGFSPKGGGFLWWYKFSDYHLQHLAIHVLEAAAEVVTLAFVAEGTRADAREGETAACLQFSDNMAWVTSVQGDKPTDPRLRDILQVRHDLQDRYQLDAQVAYVNTKVNLVADLVSRGDAAEARRHLAQHGWDLEEVQQVDLNKDPHQGPIDLELLLDRAVQHSIARELARKAEKR